jgi:hypothetical protein
MLSGKSDRVIRAMKGWWLLMHSFLRSRCAITFVALFLLMASPAALAQVDTGAIVGRVSDGSGGVIPEAKVTVKEESTGITNSVQTSGDGSYTFSPLKLGVYTVTVEKAGFKKSEQQHIEVTIQSRLEVNATLGIGDATETVEVTSSAPVLETQSASVQQLVEARAINNLPLNGRNASFLAQLSPGVTFAQSDSRNLGSSGSFTANGASRTMNNYLLDGMDNNVAIGDLVNQGQYVVMPPPDALREFTVQTSNYSAEFGHSAGAVLNVSTKSGTNAFHGDIFEYLRNDRFDAKDYFVLPTQKKPEFRLNQFGGTFGGPLTIPHVYSGRDRTFFFVDYQGTRIAQGQTYTLTVPTLAERNSGFTNMQDLISLQKGTRGDLLGRTFPTGTVFDPASTRAVTAGRVDPVTGLPASATGYVRDPFFSGNLTQITDYTTATNVALLNQIPQGRIYGNAIGLLDLYPTPNQAGLVSNYVISPSNTTTTDSMDARVDHQIGSRDSAFARYSYVFTTQNVASPFPGVADGSAARPGSGRTQSQNGAVSWTHVFAPRLVNEARVGYSRVYDRRLQPYANTLGIPAQYGIPGIPQFAGNGGLPNFSFAGGDLTAFGAAGVLPSDKASDIFQATENVTVDRGTNQIHTGFEFQHIAYPLGTPTAPRGTFANNGIFTSVVNSTDGSTGRAQFILTPQLSQYGAQFNYLGGANAVSATSYPATFYPKRNVFGAYVQDTWRATQILTLNMGVRYDFLGIPAELNGRFANFVSANTGDSSDGVSRYYIPQQHLPELPAAFTTLLASNNVVLTPITDNSLGVAQKTNFSPRFGFAFQPLTRMSVRGGYGLFFQANEDHGLSISPYIDFPFQVTSSYTANSAVQAIIANSAASTTPEGTVGPLSQGLQNVPLTSAAASVTSLQFQGQPRHPKTTYSQAYNLQVQYQVASGTILFAGYVGSNARHVQTGIPTNTTSQIASPSTPLQSISFFKTISTGGTYVASAGASNYNSLQFGGERRFSSGLSFTANMTYSKCMSNSRDLLDNGVGGYRAPYVPGLGIGADNILCTIDVRRIVHTSGTYELPFGKNHRLVNSGPASWIVGGWSMNWIFTAQDGQPFSIPCTTTTASGLGCFALKVPGQSLYAGLHNAAQFLNPNAFANPTAVAAGATGTTAALGGPGAQVTGPPFRRFDLSIFRRFPFVHESYFEFRAESFNLTNTPNLGQPTSLNFTTASTFGKIVSTRDNPNDPREIQLSLKYYF